MTLRFALLILFFLGLISCTQNNKSAKPLVLEGYTDKLSYYPGETATVYLSANRDETIELTLSTYRGKRVLSKTVRVSPQKTTTKRPWQDGYGYKPSFRIKIPELQSGVYFWNNQFPFVVKSKTPKPITVVWDSNTIHAYNWMGGKSMYYNVPATTVSFHRTILRKEAFHFTGGCLEDWEADQTLSKKMGFVADVDLDDERSIKDSKLLILIGHSEYWTRKARNNFDAFVNSGRSALILSGNTMYWQVRYNKNKDQMTCFKDAPDLEPTATAFKTLRWTNPLLRYSTEKSTGLNFVNGGFGKEAKEDGYLVNKPRSPLLKGTKLKAGDRLNLKTHEYDGLAIKGFRENGEPSVVPYENYHRWELIAYNPFLKDENRKIAAWIAFQKTPAAGRVVNTGTTNWCEIPQNGSDTTRIQKITRNMIELLLNNKPIFQTNSQEIYS